MSFAVFGENSVKAKEKAFKDICMIEGRKPYMIQGFIDRADERLAKHLSNFVDGSVDKSDYELALMELTEKIKAEANVTKISKVYDSPQAAILYRDIAKSDGIKRLRIKQKVKVFDGDGEPVFSPKGKSQKTEWVDFNAAMVPDSSSVF